MATDTSAQLFRRALECIPGGVDSPVRAMGAVGRSYPLFIDHGAGAHVWDVDGNEYIDFVSSWGPMILGWGHAEVLECVRESVGRGTSFGAPTQPEVELAEMICRAVPSIESVRMTSSGTEATMSAVRVARGHTGRDKIVKFVGCYHGHADAFLVQAGSGALTLGVPDSPGVPPATVADTLLCDYNDSAALRDVFERSGEQIACVIVEPVAGNMGVVPPEPGFLETARELCTRYGSILIFDEVITGFRVGWGGAQVRYGVMPDMTTLGKIIGGGLPVGAFGGRHDIMQSVAPAGRVYQAGTLSGNPVAMSAGLATLRVLEREGTYDRLEQAGERSESALRSAAEAAGVAVTVNRVGAMLTMFFCEGPVRSYTDVRRADAARYAAYWRHMLQRGIYLAPSQFEATMVSLAHTDGDLDTFQTAAAESLAAVG